MRVNGSISGTAQNYSYYQNMQRSVEEQKMLNEAYTNQTKAVIQGTGVFIRSSGGAGTLQHLDMIL